MKTLGLRLVCNPSPLLCSYREKEHREDIDDADAVNLSHVGLAVYDLLRTQHKWFHNQLWDVTSGSRVGELHKTPRMAWSKTKDKNPNGHLQEGHDDWFPNKMAEIISRTEEWCDIMSLAPPDGIFKTKIQDALKILSEKSKTKSKPIIVRLMFGNIPAMPVNCNSVIKSLTKGLDKKNPNLKIWVGAWRKGVSWNHAKIIAVDGKYLHTGGHNMWADHYLTTNPVHDVSLEMTGEVAINGHNFANAQWKFVKDSQSTIVGYLVDKLPDSLPLFFQIRVTVSQWPRKLADEFPPTFWEGNLSKVTKDAVQIKNVRPEVTVISLGRYGTMLRRDRPSDDAILAMLESAKTSIKMGLQDLGPVCVPGTKMSLPGCIWPKPILKALARVIWLNDVHIQIVLSNPGSIPGGLSFVDACYGNGWTCVDVASEIIRQIKKQYPKAEDFELRRKVTDNLKICFIRGPQGNFYDDGESVGMHAKHFIVDDVCTYIGSQNLYVCDLAEWGILIDSAEETRKMMEEYWHPMWSHSYTPGEDVDVQAVMDGLKINRDGRPKDMFETRRQWTMVQQAAMRTQYITNPKTNDVYQDESDDDEYESDIESTEGQKAGFFRTVFLSSKTT